MYDTYDRALEDSLIPLSNDNKQHPYLPQTITYHVKLKICVVLRAYKKICEIIPVPYVDFVPSVVPFRRFCKPKNILDSLVVPYVEKMYERNWYTSMGALE